MKRYEIVALVGIAILLSGVILRVGWEPVPEIVHPMGDVNLDSCVTQLDVDLALDFALGKKTPTEQQKALGDINGDGRINSADVSLIQGRIGICSQ